MNIEYYKTFIKLSETLNFSTTADEMFVTQSTVSNRIKELENYLGYPLFERTKRNVKLSVAGETLLPYAKKIITLNDEAVQTIQNLKFKYQIKIGAFHSAYKRYVIEAVKNYTDVEKDASIHIEIAHTNELINKLENGFLNIAIVTHIPQSNNICTVKTSKSPIILIAPNREEFLDSVSRENLAQLPFISCRFEKTFDLWWKSVINKPMIKRLSITQFSEALEFIDKGLGYAFAYEELAIEYLKNGQIKKVEIIDTELAYTTHSIIIRKELKHNDQINKFIKYLL